MKLADRSKRTPETSFSRLRLSSSVCFTYTSFPSLQNYHSEMNWPVRTKNFFCISVLRITVPIKNHSHVSVDIIYSGEVRSCRSETVIQDSRNYVYSLRVGSGTGHGYWDASEYVVMVGQLISWLHECQSTVLLEFGSILKIKFVAFAANFAEGRETVQWLDWYTHTHFSRRDTILGVTC